MDKIINILLLIIIFVFDPLAISLVVAANFAFDKAFEKNLYGEYSDTDSLYDDDSYIEDQVKTDINDIEVDAEVIAPTGPYSSRMDIIGQNGNDGEHYEEETPVEDVRPVKIIQKGPTNHNVLFSDGTQKRVNKDDNIIRYM